MIVNVQKETSKHTIIKSNCVFKRRNSLLCVGLLCKCSCSFRFVPLKEVQHGLTSLFSSFVFQYGRLRSVTCQRRLYYFGEAQGKKLALGCFHIGRCCSVVSVAKKNVEIAQVFLTATFHISSTATCLSDGTQWDSAYFSFVAVTGRDELSELQIPAVPLPGFTASAQDLWSHYGVGDGFSSGLEFGRVGPPHRMVESPAPVLRKY